VRGGPEPGTGREAFVPPVIGCGLGGLAAACTLAARGYEVVVLERNSWLGGKAAVLEEDGSRFDMGPTILLMPSVLRRIFAEAGRDLNAALELLPLDPQWRSFFDDGSTLDLHADRSRMIESLESLAPGKGIGRGYERFMDRSEALRSISEVARRTCSGSPRSTAKCPCLRSTRRSGSPSAEGRPTPDSRSG
jgi:phytoene dehydrogenase-like protein